MLSSLVSVPQDPAPRPAFDLADNRAREAVLESLLSAVSADAPRPWPLGPSLPSPSQHRRSAPPSPTSGSTSTASASHTLHFEAGTTDSS